MPMKYSALLTDFYQLSMAYAYWQSEMHEQSAVFHVFFRRNPLQGDYVIASGLEAVIDFLNQFQFSQKELDYLASLKNPTFSYEFLQYLKTLRFTGDIDAIPEGSVVFANEPLLRIKAPLILCQLLETPLINLINFASSVATMASRIRTLTHDSLLFEFGLRRAQGPNGGLTASRAAYLGGFDATSNIAAGKTFDIPVVGTMAHSWVMAFDDELTAFSEYARLLPDNIILLVDTYDTAAGVDHAITVGHALKKEGRALKGIRLDSGDLGALSFMARQKLNTAGFSYTTIYVSGDLTEERITELTDMEAPIDGFGVGTHLSTSYAQPALDMVYKLGAIEQQGQWHYKLKRSDNQRKTSDPGILQVKRYYDDKKWVRDVIYHEVFGVTKIHDCEKLAARDLLIPIFRAGKCVYSIPRLKYARQFCMQKVSEFHASKGVSYSVARDSALLQLKQKLMERAMHCE